MPKEIHVILKEILGGHTIIKNWVVQFKRGGFSTCEAPRPGRHKRVTSSEIMVQIHNLNLVYRRILD